MRRIFLLAFIGFTSFLYSQNVGIGTAVPAAKLEVRGDFRLSGSSSNYVNFTLPASSQTTNYILPTSTGTNGQFLKTDGTGTLSWGGINTTATDFLVAQEEQANNVAGGNAINNAWNTRILNTTVTLSGTAISHNTVNGTIKLKQAGTYHIRALAPSIMGQRHQLVIRDSATNAILLYGTNEYSFPTNQYTQSSSSVEGFITISNATTFKLDHFIQNQNNNQTLGMENAVASGIKGVFSRCVVEKMQTTPVASSSSSWSDYLLVYEQKPNAAVCGSATAGGFTQRDLTNVQASAGTAITFNSASHSITLNQVGTYYIKASAPCHRGVRHQLIIRGLPSNSVLLTGTSEFTSNGGSDTPDVTHSFVEGFLTISTSTTFDLAHFIQSNGGGTETLGIANSAASGLVGNFAHCFVQKIQ